MKHASTMASAGEGPRSGCGARSQPEGGRRCGPTMITERVGQGNGAVPEYTTIRGRAVGLFERLKYAGVIAGVDGDAASAQILADVWTL